MTNVNTNIAITMGNVSTDTMISSVNATKGTKEEGVNKVSCYKFITVCSMPVDSLSVLCFF